MKIIKNIKQLLTLQKVAQKDGRNLLPEDLSIIEDASIVYDQKAILWVGKTNELPVHIQGEVIDGHEWVITPEIIDAHTHLVFAGNRAWEYGEKINGVDYQAIAQRGGGILETMRQTQSRSEDELFELSAQRIERINSYGIGTIEIKSGYGGDWENEYKIMQVIDRLKKKYAPKIRILSTYMGAHAKPLHQNKSMEFLTQVVLPQLEDLAKENLVDAVDIFHEAGYFDSQEVITLAKLANKLKIPLKAHVDEFQDNNGIKNILPFHPLSVDHCLHSGELDPTILSELAKSSTVVNLLPGTAFFLGKQLPAAQRFLQAGCKVAIASDYNPGSCHCDNLILLTSIAIKSLGMNMAQSWAAITYNAAGALGLANSGAITIGNLPRFSIFKANSHEEIFYSWGQNLSILSCSK